MKVITDLGHFNKEKYPNLVVALGNFDGVHLGHQEIIKTISDRAKRIGGLSAVFTFKEHPQRVLLQKEDPPILTSYVHKLYLLKQYGLDLCFLIDFTQELSRQSPEEFVEKIFTQSLGAREICLGFNARFGHNRAGDSKLMGRLSQKLGFQFIEAGPYRVRGEVVSSSLIRSLIREGKLKEASQFLGRPYSFFGTVIKGSGRGSGLGFPTANLDSHSEVMPPEGVYAAWVRILDCQFKGSGQLEDHVIRDHLKGVLNYGRRPTFESTLKPVPEVHILDYDNHLYGNTLEVVIGEWLRAEQNFTSYQALKAQIREDIQTSQKWFEKQIS